MGHGCPSAHFPQIQDGSQGAERMRGNVNTFSVSTFLFSANPSWRPRRRTHARERQHFFRQHFLDHIWAGVSENDSPDGQRRRGGAGPSNRC